MITQMAITIKHGSERYEYEYRTRKIRIWNKILDLLQIVATPTQHPSTDIQR